MTSSKEKDCCPKCLVDRTGWCNNLSCPCHKEKECCEKCWNSKYALRGKNKERFGCGLSCECHLEQWKKKENLPTSTVVSTQSSTPKTEKVVFPCPKCEGANVPTHTPSCHEEKGCDDCIRLECWKPIVFPNEICVHKCHSSTPKTEEWEQTMRWLLGAYHSEREADIRATIIYDMTSLISSLILKTKEETIKENNSSRLMSEVYEIGKKEERERILAVIDSLPDLKPEGTHKWIDAHTLVCAIQEQEKKEE